VDYSDAWLFLISITNYLYLFLIKINSPCLLIYATTNGTFFFGAKTVPIFKSGFIFLLGTNLVKKNEKTQIQLLYIFQVYSYCFVKRKFYLWALRIYLLYIFQLLIFKYIFYKKILFFKYNFISLLKENTIYEHKLVNDFLFTLSLNLWLELCIFIKSLNNTMNCM
jgi:hypothetical protein